MLTLLFIIILTSGLLTITMFVLALSTFLDETGIYKRKELSSELFLLFIFGAIFVISALSYYFINH